VRMSERYKDKDWLVEQYHDKDQTTIEMGEMCDVNPGTISYWMDKHDIEAYDQGRNKRTPGMNLVINGNGYLEWQNQVYENSEIIRRETYRVHRLVAVAEYGVEEVKDKVVHHQNGVKIDNRPENLKLLDHGTHTKQHNEDRIEEIREQAKSRGFAENGDFLPGE